MPVPDQLSFEMLALDKDDVSGLGTLFGHLPMPHASASQLSFEMLALDKDDVSGLVTLFGHLPMPHASA